MTTKVCLKCKEEKDISEFGKRYDKTQPLCRTCNAERSAAYYAANREKHKKEATERNARQQAKYMKWKQTLSCQSCSEDYGPCMAFHHVDPALKEFEISTGLGRYGVNKLLDEIRKCVVVCSNCHIKIHNGHIECPEIDQEQNIELLTEMLDVNIRK